jgi:HrpA-like RNA helicase
MSILTEIHKEKLLTLIDCYDKLMISASTGTGKSTTMMEWIIEKNYSVFNTQLTKPATSNLGRYEKQRLGEDAVGTAFDGYVRYINSNLEEIRNGHYRDEDNTPLVYCTSGHMRRIFLSLYTAMRQGRRNLLFTDIIVLDEAHLKTADQDVILRIHSLLKSKGCLVPKLILCSATLDIEREDLPLLEVKGKDKKVDLEYHGSNFTITDKRLYIETAKVVLMKHNENLPGEKGDVWLIFCPGELEIEAVYNQICNETMEVCRAHSDLSTEEMNAIFTPPSPYTRKIIIATNIAETSLTIENVSYVFDTMTEKIAETSVVGGLRLSLTFISKSSANQRMGRTGRTRDGKCYRMCDAEFFNSLPEQRKDEILRIPLHTMMLELISVSLDPRELFPAIPSLSFSSTLELLCDLNLVVYEDDMCFVTDVGRFVSKFPLSVRGGTVLNRVVEGGMNLFPSLVMICIIEVVGDSSFFYFPKKSIHISHDEYKEQCNYHYEKYFEEFRDRTMVGCYINVLNLLIEETGVTTLHELTSLPYKTVLDFSLHHSLNNKKFHEFLSLLRKCGHLLSNSINVRTININTLLKEIIPIYRSVYRDMTFERVIVRNNVSYTNNGLLYFVPNGKTDVKCATYDKVIGLITAEVVQGKKISRFLSLYLPYDENDI